MTRFLIVSIVFVCAISSVDSRAQTSSSDVPSEVAPDPEIPAQIDVTRPSPIRLPNSFSPSSTEDPPASGGVWRSQGPGPTVGGQVENIEPDNEVVGAVHTLVAHPTNADIVWLGATNGGIWRSDNATAVQPTWRPLTDDQPSLSIGALELDPTDTSNRTLVAAIGRFSSFSRLGGVRTGLLKSTDGGDSWVSLGSEDLFDRNLSGVASRGHIVVVTANTFGRGAFPGVYRSVDGGRSFTNLSENGTIPNGSAFDLVGDSSDLSRLYIGTENGIYRSSDSGSSWVNVSSNAMNLLFLNPFFDINNVELAVHFNRETGSHALYGAIMNDGQLAGIFRSSDFGDSWTEMDIPQTNEGGSIIGLQPRVKPGSQGGIHFAIVADPVNPDLVYVGGDRQPRELSWPNSIGAFEFSGRLFRGDASVAATGETPSPQWSHLTHLSNLIEVPLGGTASSSSPHADSREMVFDANGDLIEGDDNTGDWFSMNGDLQITEMHDVAYDTVSNIIIGGAQDTGTHEQQVSNGVRYTDIGLADGGDVVVDDTTEPGASIRYYSNQNLGFPRRRRCDANNVCDDPVFIFPTFDDNSVFAPQFVTPVELNNVDQRRLIIGGFTGVFESLNQGDNLLQVPSPAYGADQITFTRSLFYGHRDNADLIVAAVIDTNISASDILIRQSRTEELRYTEAPLPYGQVRDVVVDPDNQSRIYVLADEAVFVTDDSGASWRDISGNLQITNKREFRTITFVQPGKLSRIVVAGQSGIFFASTEDPDNWSTLGNGIPNAPIWDLDYDLSDDFLVAATLGRGVWSLADVSAENLAPITHCKSELTIETTPGRCDATPDFKDSVFDADGDRLKIVRRPSGPLDTGSIRVVWSAKDSFGLRDTCRTRITVEDKEAPRIQCNVPTSINRDALPATFTVTSSDNCKRSDIALSELSCGSESCEASINNSSVTLTEVGNVPAKLRWKVTASDGSNIRTKTCQVAVQDDVHPVLTIESLEVSESTQSVSLLVRAQPAPSQDISLSVATSATGATATPGVDFYGMYRQLTIPAGQTQIHVPLTVLNDTKPEGNENFFVRIFNPLNSKISRGIATVTIIDDDAH